MSGIYLRDLNINRVEDRLVGNRRPLDVLLPILKLITPQDAVITKQWSTPLGTRINYAHAATANFIYESRVTATLTKYNLKAHFSNVTAFDRQVWLTDTPEIIFNKDISTLTQDIVQSTNTRFLS